MVALKNIITSKAKQKLKTYQIKRQLRKKNIQDHDEDLLISFIVFYVMFLHFKVEKAVTSRSK